MTKTMARVLAVILTLGTLFLVFQVRFISPAEGKHVMVYAVPGKSELGASAGEDLRDQLREKFGEETEGENLGPVVRRDQDAYILEDMNFVLKNLGRSFGGTRYVLCDVEFRRTIVGEGGDPLDKQIKTVTYLAQETDGEERAQILWDTEQVNYSDRQEDFDNLAGTKRQ